MPCSAEQRSRRATKERERRAVEAPASRQTRLDTVKAATRDRRAAETPPSRQVRLASDKASTQRRRQAQTLESSITAKRRNSRMRAELRRQAAAVAAARYARRDATHSDAFEHLLWLHSCSGSLGVMNARRLFVYFTSRKLLLRLLVKTIPIGRFLCTQIFRNKFCGSLTPQARLKEIKHSHRVSDTQLFLFFNELYVKCG